MKTLLLISFCFLSLGIHCQFDFEDQIPDNNNKGYTSDIVDEVYGILIYEPLNLGLSPDSVRMENGYAINNWKEDFYANGQLLHKGYYINGQLKVYKNYYPDGTMERDFKNIDGFRSKSSLFYPNGKLKSEVTYLSGSPIKWTDYYENGNMEYHEEQHKNLLYHIVKKSFYDNGQVETALEMVNKKKLLFNYNEFYKDGLLKVEGTIKYDMNRYDYHRTGTWNFFNFSGEKIKQDDYSNGKVIKSKTH